MRMITLLARKIESKSIRRWDERRMHNTQQHAHVLDCAATADGIMVDVVSVMAHPLHPSLLDIHLFTPPAP